MIPTLIELIPIYGMFKYSKRYFKAEKRGYKEANIAQWFQTYHMITGLIIAFYVLFKLNILPM
jgi:hypothetical protein